MTGGRDTILWTNSLLGALLAHGLAYLSVSATWSATEEVAETQIVIKAPPRRLTTQAPATRSAALSGQAERNAAAPVDEVGAARTVEDSRAVVTQNEPSSPAPVASQTATPLPGAERAPSAASMPRRVDRLRAEAASPDVEGGTLVRRGRTEKVAEPTRESGVAVAVTADTRAATRARTEAVTALENATQASGVEETRDVAALAVEEPGGSTPVKGQALPATAAPARAIERSREVAVAVEPTPADVPALRFGATDEPVAEREPEVALAVEGDRNVAGRVDGSDAGRTIGPAIDERYEKLLTFLETFGTRDCAAVLPRVEPNGTVVLFGFAQNRTFWEAFRTAALDALGEVLPVDAARVTPAQCESLRFATQVPSYPRFTLALDLERNEIRSGEMLRLSIENVRSRHVHLLLVDDEGLVQTADRILQPKAAGYGAAFPVTLTSGDVETAQMLIAIAVDEPLSILEPSMRRTAADLFAELRPLVAEKHGDADLALASFYVRR